MNNGCKDFSFPGLACLANPVDLKATPSAVYFHGEIVGQGQKNDEPKLVQGVLLISLTGASRRVPHSALKL